MEEERGKKKKHYYKRKELNIGKGEIKKIKDIMGRIEVEVKIWKIRKIEASRQEKG